MAVLTINWESADRVSPMTAAITPSEGEEAAAEEVIPMASRPLLVYVTPPADAEEGFNKIEQVVLTDDKIAVGTKAFRCIKISAENAAADPLLAEAGKEAPRFVLITPDYEYTKVLEGRRISVSGMYGAMKAVAKKSYRTNFDKNIRNLVKLLNEFDKINNERALIDAKEERLENPTKADLAKIEKAREELAAREREAAERKEELLTFELKEEFLAA
ncbi:MAG: hypothetical protein ACYTG6_10900 [Planctomycetota bacterium]|jgi:hypothetical protein